MSSPDFQHLRLSMVKDVAVVEIRTRDLLGPILAQELGTELALVAAQEWARRLLVDFRRVTYVSSTGFAALFKLLSRARAEGRQVKLCGMENGVRLGAEIVGLQKLVEIHDDEAAALRTFAAGLRVGLGPNFPSTPISPDTNFPRDTNSPQVFSRRQTSA